MNETNVMWPCEEKSLLMSKHHLCNTGIDVRVQILYGVPKSCHNVTLFCLLYLLLFLPCKDTFMDDYDGI